MGEALTAAVNALSAAEAAEPARAGSFVIPDHKVAYIVNPGAADLTVKWLLAELSGQDPTRFHDTLRPVRTRNESIQVRAQWRRVPTLERHLRAGGTVDDDWFVFALAYQPHERLWATWQLRYLAGDPHLADELLERSWFPREPVSTEQVVEDFGRFVRALAGRSADRVPRADPIRAQTALLCRDGLRYTHVYAPSELEALRTDLARHLDEQGGSLAAQAHVPDPLPLPLTDHVLGDGVAALLEEVYAVDLERLGAGWPDGPVTSAEPWDSAAFRGLSFQRAVHRRIRDLTVSASGLASDVARRADVRERQHEGSRS